MITKAIIIIKENNNNKQKKKNMCMTVVIYTMYSQNINGRAISALFIEFKLAYSPKTDY